MHTLRSQQSKSTRCSSRRCEKLLPGVTQAGAAPIKAKNPSLISEPSSTTTSNQVTEDGTLMCKAPGCNFTTKHQSRPKPYADCHGKQRISSRRSEPTEFTARKSLSNVPKPPASEKFKCNKCSYSSTIKRNLTRHFSTHSQVQPFGCHYCEYRSRWSQNLNKHLKRKHSGKPSQISGLKKMKKRGEVSQRQVAQRQLTRKMPTKKGSVTVTPSKKIITAASREKVKCPKCELRCYPYHLKAHLRVHSDEKPFGCTVKGCSYRTKWPYGINTHMQSHGKVPKIRPATAPPLRQSCETNVKGFRGRKKPLAADQPEVDKELNSVKDDEEEKEILEEALVEPLVELADSTGFACMLCHFVGYSERAALEHAQCHTRPAFPIDQLDEIPVICLN